MTQSKTLDTGSDGMEDRATARSEWQPIETAPKDGRRVFIARDMGDPWGWVRGLAYYEKVRGIEGWIAVAGVSDVPGVLGLADPTHWTPIPKPPSSSERSERLPHPHTGGREAVTTALAFLDGIEGQGYGGMASFEIAREGLRALSPPLQKTQKETM